MRTITLTGRPPVRILEDNWPIIAEATHRDHDGQIRCQANRTWKAGVYVRQHADGRAIVYAVDEHYTAFQREQGYTIRRGALLAPGDDIPTAVHVVVEQIINAGAAAYVRPLAEECIADLPAEDLDDEQVTGSNAEKRSAAFGRMASLVWATAARFHPAWEAEERARLGPVPEDADPDRIDSDGGWRIDYQPSEIHELLGLIVAATPATPAEIFKREGSED